MSGHEVIRGLLDAIASMHPEPDDLLRFAADAGINDQLLAGQGRIADENNRLVEAAVSSDKVAALLQVVLREREG
jgi:hypothetical protein